MEHYRRRSSGHNTSASLSPPPSTTSRSSRSPLGRTISGALRRLTNQREDEDESPSEIPKGPLGLVELHTVPDPLIEFIFIHGLGGGSQKTWSLTSDPYQYWPKYWLPRNEAFARVSIHSFGYKADWTERKESLSSIHDFALSLTNAIYCNHGLREGNSKIVLVAHSMGGIVAKKAYMLAREDKALRKIADRIHTIFFLATPHRGADLAKTLGNVLWASGASKTFVTELNRSSDSIPAINDSFRHFAEDLKLWSFYETIDTYLGITKVRIVDKNSATLGVAHEMTSPLDADHRGVCKFDQETDSNFQTLLKAFTTTIDFVCAEETQAKTENVAEQRYRLSTMLGLDEHVENGMLPLEDLRVPGSCTWLAARPLYQIWQAAQPSSRPIFWLEGSPGFGKSTLCAHTIEELTQRELSCSYFFFKHGDATRSTVAQCLIALANQMAMSDIRVLERLLAMQHDISQIKNWDEKTIWRKLFVGCIFPSLTKTPHYWIIDALDECKRFPVLLSFLAQTPPTLRLFVTSRITLDIEKSRTTLVNLCEVYRLQEKDTLDDIGLFVESRMDRLPAGNDDDRRRLKTKILEKASGSFLWTTLVVKELESAYSDESAEEILNEIPVDMNQFYARMVESILENRRAVKLAASIFLWTLFSLRPLKVSELQSALKLDTGQTVHNLEKSITAICGQLVIVNSMNEVGIVHETARAYLLEDGSFPGLARSRQNHTRIAGLCLFALSEHLPKCTTIRRRQPAPSDCDTALTSYACEYFSDHLYMSTSEDPSNWNLLFKFLQTNTGIWIESLAKMGNLRPIPRTAKNLQGYMKRRLKYTSILDTTRDDLEMWSTDLLRLHGKFGSHLHLSPSSIHSIIPALCPSESNLAAKNASRLPQSRLHIRGVIEQSWNDCLIQIDYPARQTGALAHGDRYVAVALSDGTVTIYYHDSAHPRSVHDHGERVKSLSFSNNDQYLASSGLKTVKVWDIASGTLLYTFNTVRQALCVHFMDDEVLVAATQDSRITTWHLHDGAVSRQWSWIDTMLGSGQNRPQQQPAKAHISESKIMAVCYRGLPVHLFDLETEQFMGYCSRDTMSLNGGTSNHTPVDSLVFKESSESDGTLLVVSYGDGELVVYNADSLQLCSRIPGVYAHSLACSPDGHVLVTGSSQGAIQIFEFGGDFDDHLTLIYRIDAYDDGIRDISFSRDGSNFADIRGSQYRMWQPTILMRSDDEEFSQSEFSSAISVAPKSVPMSEGALAAEITTICSHPNAGYVFCGKQNGHVVAFETSHATQSQFLYQHATNTSVTAIVYNENKSVLASVDESGRILVYTVIVTDMGSKIDSHVADIRTHDTAMTLLLDHSGTKILVQRKTALDIWTMEGIKSHTILRPTLDGDSQTYSDRVLLNHPLDPRSFLCVDSDDLQIHSWEGQVNISGLSIRSSLHTDRSSKSQTTIVNLQKASPALPSVTATLRAWRLVEQASTPAFTASTPILGIHAEKIRQIIAVEGDLALFIDTSFWVCSIDLSRNVRSTLGIKRHFFLLSEWRNSDGQFVMEYIPKDRDFVVAKRDGILVLSAGLGLEEPWLPQS